jgi:ABC-type transport system substrate-binding protein
MVASVYIKPNRFTGPTLSQHLVGTERAISWAETGLVVSLLVALAMISGIMFPANIVNAASSSGCPANRILHYTYPPLPNGFNLISSVPGGSDFEIGHLMYLSLTPFPLGVTTTFSWSDSLTDWYTSNSNYTQWTFNIKPGSQWSDGDYVTANDVINWASPSYALNPNYDYVGLHTEVVKETALNASTVVFNLNASDAHFAEKIGSNYYAPVMSPEEVARGVADPLFGTDVVDGPFYVANYTTGSTSLTMLRNPYFKPLPNICEILFSFVETSAAMMPSIVSGEADLAGGGYFNYGNIPALQGGGYPNLHLAITKGSATDKLVYNLAIYPYNMTQFRQAMAYGINSSAVVQSALFGYGVPANEAQGDVSPMFPTYNPNQVKYDYNPQKSLQLLGEIGFKMGADGMLHYPNGTVFSATLWTDLDFSFDSDAAQVVAQDLSQNLGMQINMQSVLVSTLLGDYFGNANGIRNNLILIYSPGAYYGDRWLDAQPQCAVAFQPGCIGYWGAHWLMPPSADAQYQSNLTAIDRTGNPALEQKYLNNIQYLNSQYLPWIMVAYPDMVSVYNTARWTNWPTAPSVLWYMLDNKTSLETLQPVGPTTTSTSAASTLSTSASTASTSMVTTIVSTVTTSASSTLGTYALIGGVVIAIVAIAGAFAYISRARKKPS